MKTTIEYQKTCYQINLAQPLDISLPLTTDPTAASAWYCPPTRIEAVRMGDWVGEVTQGGSVNFRNVIFNPHGNGTHTECLGHISKENYTLQACMQRYFFYARLVSILPETISNGDLVITAALLAPFLQSAIKPEALIIRSLPNNTDKRQRQYTNTNPPYLSADAMQLIVDAGIEHLLIDLPSVDRESDEGLLAGHHIFWNYPAAPRLQCTITEFIYVDNAIKDGDYFLNLQVCAIENDAAPSKPCLYEVGF